MKFLILLCFLGGVLAHEYQCEENQQYNECGTACPLSCRNYQNPPKICNTICMVGCECKKGYVLTDDGDCVLPENCPPKDCESEPDEGWCRAYIPSWYYDPKTGTCEEFVYGGCDGNGNRYSSEEECMKTCAEVKRAVDRTDCDKAPETGLCKASITRYYFDQQTFLCKVFTYGGCGGNKNNFETEAECYNRCGVIFHPGNPICEQEKEVGPCRAAIPRYFYNKETGQCEKFIYGGCLGNENNFGTKSDCETICVESSG